MHTSDDYLAAIAAPARAARGGAMGQAAMRHLSAWYGVRDGYERGLVAGIHGLAHYAAAYEAEFGDKVGTDGVLGVAFAAQLRGWRALLNGPLGRLDGGFLDAAACALWDMAGFAPEEL